PALAAGVFSRDAGCVLGALTATTLATRGALALPGGVHRGEPVGRSDHSIIEQLAADLGGGRDVLLPLDVDFAALLDAAADDNEARFLGHVTPPWRRRRHRVRAGQPAQPTAASASGRSVPW